VAFTGWSDAAIDFYDGLEEDNSKSYWQAHKTVYDAAVKEPMEALLQALAAEFGPGRIFRPNRDVRFSADKSPYKTAIAATLDNGGYIQLSAAGLATGRGMYTMAADQLDRFRRAVAADRSGAELVEAVGTLQAAGVEILAHEKLKIAPRGFPRDHPRLDLLRLKGLVAWKQWPIGPWLATAQAKSRVVGILHRAEPVSEWLDIHVGPSTQPGAFGR
jgi:uncharacterized protein (TIGR02453 family)